MRHAGLLNADGKLVYTYGRNATTKSLESLIITVHPDKEGAKYIAGKTYEIPLKNFLTTIVKSSGIPADINPEDFKKEVKTIVEKMEIDNTKLEKAADALKEIQDFITKIDFGSDKKYADVKDFLAKNYYLPGGYYKIRAGGISLS
jgi:hypothetical protein